MFGEATASVAIITGASRELGTCHVDAAAKAIREMARELGRSPSTVSDEVARHRIVTSSKSTLGEHRQHPTGCRRWLLLDDFAWESHELAKVEEAFAGSFVHCEWIDPAVYVARLVPAPVHNDQPLPGNVG